MSDDAISVEQLVKTFGSTRALDGLDLTVAHGSVHGFLGPNGSGKSTTIRVLLGLLRASSGRVRVLGGDPWRDSVSLHRRLAYVPGDVALWPNLTGGEAIDEPTAGLDPIMAAEFQELVRECSSRGSTVLLSSHVLGEVEALCDRVTIIRAGRAVESGSLEDLRHLTRTAMVVRTARPVADLSGLDGVHNLVLNHDGTARFDVDTAHLEALHRRLAEAGIVALTSSPPTLEELFLRHYGVGPGSSPAEGRATPEPQER